MSNLQSSSEMQPYRTGYHFQPPINWLNDPNGPIYFNGVYHLFYQYNPFGPVWGNIAWGHAVSYDLVSWVHIDPAISPTEPFDIKGCWSGSATIRPGEPLAILYTGGDTNNRQVQNLAIPKDITDPFLTEWVKSPHNPIISPPDDIEPDDFRDPTTAWQGPDDVWRILIGSRVNGHGAALLYRSTDFVNWVRSDNPFQSSEKTGMLECPDFFPVRINSNRAADTSSQDKFTKHVFKASFHGQDHYILGTYMPEIDEFSGETSFLDGVAEWRFDYGKFYASKTFFDGAKNRCIIWAWLNESCSESEDIKKGWSGIMSFPRTVLLSETGQQLVQWPVEEIEKLRSNNFIVHDQVLEAGSKLEVTGITASQADVEISFDILNVEDVEPWDPSWTKPQLLCSQQDSSVRGKVGPFGLLVLATDDLTEQTAVYFRIFRKDNKLVVLMCSDQSRSSLGENLDKTTFGTFIDIDPLHEKITLRSLIDHSVVESFGGEGRAVITARVYPTLAIDEKAHLFVFNNGTTDVRISRLTAWSMKNAEPFPMKLDSNDPSNLDA